MNYGIRSEISMPDRSFTSNRTDQPIGLMALIRELDLPVRRPVYAPSGIVGNLKFALRYKPIDLGVYDGLFGVLDSELLEVWIRQEPTGIYVRRA
jgi:hypothetical protein